MLNTRVIAASIAGFAAVAALIVVIDRGGVIAWSTFILGVALLGKVRLRPSSRDPGLSIALVIVPVLAWVGTFYYVISVWESGEVVELAIDTPAGVHTARLWVLDIEAQPLVYYDAEADVAESLLAGNPLQFTRGSEVSIRIPKARRVEAVPEEEANQILEAMAAKYGDLNTAATVYYLLLGSSQDRIELVATLNEE